VGFTIALSFGKVSSIMKRLRCRTATHDPNPTLRVLIGCASYPLTEVPLLGPAPPRPHRWHIGLLALLAPSLNATACPQSAEADIRPLDGRHLDDTHKELANAALLAFLKN
jgi:hypothetical protein